MDLLKVAVIVLFVILTILTIKVHPGMHQPMLIEDADFKLTRISDTIKTNNIVSIQPKQENVTKNINIESLSRQEQNVLIDTEENKPKYVETVQPEKKEIVAQLPKKTKNVETSQDQLELLQQILQNTEKELGDIVIEPEPKKVEQQRTNTNKVQPVQQNSNNKNPYMSEQEELIAWNIWRSNIQNQVMSDSNIQDYVPIGTLFTFSFLVDKFGNVSNIKVECSNPDYMNIARNNVKPAIANLQKKQILNFPKGTRRTSTVMNGSFLIGLFDRFSTPGDFHDIERVVH